MLASTDKVLSNIFLHSMGDTSEGRSALQNLLSTSEKLQWILGSNAELHCFVELSTTYLVPEIETVEPYDLPLFSQLFLSAVKVKNSSSQILTNTLIDVFHYHVTSKRRSLMSNPP